MAVRFDDPEGGRSRPSSRMPRSGRSTGSWPWAIGRWCWRRGSRTRWDCRGNPPEAARPARTSCRARERFASAGLVAPWHMMVPPTADPVDVARRAQYPAVVKPLGLSGSRGVIRADSPEALVAAFERVRALLARPDVRALRLDSGDAILVEGYLEGREYAIEGVLTGGVFRRSRSSTSPIRSTVRSSRRPSTSRRRSCPSGTRRPSSARSRARPPRSASARSGPCGVSADRRGCVRARSRRAADRRSLLAGAAVRRVGRDLARRGAAAPRARRGMSTVSARARRRPR